MKFLPDGRATVGSSVMEEATIIRARAMIEMRLGGATHESIGSIYGVTRERVRQILKEHADLAGDRREQVFVPDTPRRREIEARKRHLVARRGLLRVFTSNYFQREEVLRLTGWPDDGSDIELCEKLHSTFRIVCFGGYIRCGICHTVKPLAEFMPSAKRTNNRHCRKCNAKRINARHHLYPEERRKYYNKDRRYIAFRRWEAKKDGRIQDMPPLDGPAPPRRTFNWTLRWASMTPEQRAAQLAKAAEGYRKWRESLTEEGIKAHVEKIRIAKREKLVHG